MSSLNSIYIKKETLETLLDVLSKKQEKGVELTVSINDETNDYGQNISAYVSQSKEQREQGVNRFYVGNGKTFWTDGQIQAFRKQDDSPKVAASSNGTDDLPF